MLIRSSASANTFAFTNHSTSAGLIFSLFAGLLSFASIGFISTLPAGLILSMSVGSLMPVEQDMTKPFYIGKLVTSVNNTTALIYIKKTFCIGKVLFPPPDDVWQYMLTILNKS